MQGTQVQSLSKSQIPYASGVAKGIKIKTTWKSIKAWMYVQHVVYSYNPEYYPLQRAKHQDMLYKPENTLQWKKADTKATPNYYDSIRMKCSRLN